TRPSSSSTEAVSASGWASSVTSTRRAIAEPPLCWIASALRVAAAGSISAATTRDPSAENRRALASPIPEPAPVMRHTLSWSRTRSEILSAIGADHAGDPQRDQDDGAVDGIDPGRADVGKGQDVGHQREQNDAGQGTHHATAPAVERDPADDGGREEHTDQDRA